MKYINYLKNKNLAKTTIDIYIKEYQKWYSYLGERKPNKTLFVKYINSHTKTHSPNSIRLIYSSLISIFKFEKKWKLINQCKDIKLPTTQQINRKIISLIEYENVKNIVKLNSKIEKRNWIIFSFLFLTGVRVSELLEFNKNKIYDENKLKIKGKGNKIRVIFLTKYLQELLTSWKANRIPINSKNKLITIKQINTIVKKISNKYFNKELTPHGLRRSYATNLLKNNVNIEIVKQTLGHSNINTTSRYIQINEEDIYQEITKIMN